MRTEPDWDGITRRLDIMIMLLMENGADGATSTTHKINKLLDLGLSQPEVARVIGKKLNYVTAVISGKKRSTKAKPAADKGQVE